MTDLGHSGVKLTVYTDEGVSFEVTVTASTLDDAINWGKTFFKCDCVFGEWL